MFTFRLLRNLHNYDNTPAGSIDPVGCVFVSLLMRSCVPFAYSFGSHFLSLDTFQFLQHSAVYMHKEHKEWNYVNSVYSVRCIKTFVQMKFRDERHGVRQRKKGQKKTGKKNKRDLWPRVPIFVIGTHIPTWCQTHTYKHG